jgi:hypothetical protein
MRQCAPQRQSRGAPPPTGAHFIEAGRHNVMTGALSSEVDTDLRKENASKKDSGASVLIQSEPIML